MKKSRESKNCNLASASFIARVGFKSIASFKIEAKRTLHMRYDPLAVEPIEAESRTLTPVDIEVLRERLAKVEENETAPKSAKGCKPLPEVQTIVKAKDAEIESLQRQLQLLKGVLASAGAEAQIIFDSARKLTFRLGGQSQRPSTFPSKQNSAEEDKAPEPPTPPIEERAAEPTEPSDETLTEAQSKIARALGRMLALGKTSVDRRVTAALAGFSHKSGSYAQNLAALRRFDIIETSGEGLALTAKGKAAFREKNAPSLGELHAAWMSQVSSTQARMLRAFISFHPKGITRDELAGVTNQSPKSGSFAQNLARLRALGLIAGSRDLSSTALVFPEGLK